MAKSSKLSKMAANRLAVTATVSSSAAVHGPELAAQLHEALYPEGPQRPDMTLKMLGALGKLLDRTAAEVEAADLAHAAELLDDEEPRQRRDVAYGAVTALLLAHRGTLDALYGPAVSGSYGLSGALPTVPSQLLLRARSVLDQYRSQPLPARPLRPGVTLKLSALTEELKGPVEGLAVALEDVQRESREAQLTQQRKQQAIEAWDRVYQGVTYAFYGLYLLAGRRDLAERIEPTARRRAGLPEAEDQGGQPAADPVPHPAPAPVPAPAPGP